jgi:hypothetical protein
MVIDPRASSWSAAMPGRNIPGHPWISMHEHLQDEISAIL